MAPLRIASIIVHVAALRTGINVLIPNDHSSQPREGRQSHKQQIAEALNFIQAKTKQDHQNSDMEQAELRLSEIVAASAVDVRSLKHILTHSFPLERFHITLRQHSQLPG